MKKYGQSIIEYVLIAVLVILGIVIMGAYVLRATNAHFKLWDEGVQDSFQETLTQVSQNRVPFISTNCNCNDVTTNSCGSISGTAQCSDAQMVWSHNCLPQLCDGRPASFCKDDDTDCCSTYIQGNCGTNPLIGGAAPAGTAITGHGLPANCVTYSPFTGCYYDQYAWSTPCSDLPVACCPTTAAACAAQCTGIVLYAGSALACPNQPPAKGALNQNEPYSYVAADNLADCGTAPHCTYCDPRNKLSCQVYCNQAAGYLPQYSTILNPDGTTTLEVTGCINNFTVAPIPCGCGGCNCQQQACPCYNINGTPSASAPTGPDFSVCATNTSLSIISAIANPTSTSTSCGSASCCNDNGVNNCLQFSQVAGATPECKCQITSHVFDANP